MTGTALGVAVEVEVGMRGGRGVESIILVLTTSRGVVSPAAIPPLTLPHSDASHGGRSLTSPVFERP